MEQQTLHEKYELSTLTMLVTPYFDDFGNVYSRVIEEEQEFIVKRSPLQIMDESCEHFGSDLRGRQRATEVIAGFVYKQPIAVEPLNKIYFFPTASPKSTSCAWLSHTHIHRIYRACNGQSEVVFLNGKRHLIDVTKHSLTNQLHRTAQLRCAMEQRIKLPDNFLYPHLPLIADPKKFFPHFS